MTKIGRPLEWRSILVGVKLVTELRNYTLPANTVILGGEDACKWHMQNPVGHLMVGVGPWTIMIDISAQGH